jgi:hypothetical protein
MCNPVPSAAKSQPWKQTQQSAIVKKMVTFKKEYNTMINFRIIILMLTA